MILCGRWCSVALWWIYDKKSYTKFKFEPLAEMKADRQIDRWTDRNTARHKHKNRQMEEKYQRNHLVIPHLHCISKNVPLCTFLYLCQILINFPIFPSAHTVNQCCPTFLTPQSPWWGVRGVKPPEAETLFASECSMETANLPIFLKFGNAKDHQTLLNFASWFHLTNNWTKTAIYVERWRATCCLLYTSDAADE